MREPLRRRFRSRTAGTVAARLFGGRGWRLHSPYDPYQMSRPIGAGLLATLSRVFHGYLGTSDALIGELRFQRDGAPVPLDSVPLSKVLLLNDDEKITDPGILAQPQARTQSPE